MSFTRYNKTIVITPTRSRPENFARMVKSCQEMSGGSIDIYAGLDDDDPRLQDYQKVKSQFGQIKFFVGSRKSLSSWTNELAMQAIKDSDLVKGELYLVSMGDDHVVRSSFWETKMISMLRLQPGPGFAYGDDLMNGSGLCTCWMASARAVEKLGWMMLPRCNHMYVDNAIMELGSAAHRLTYIPDLVIEHMHHVMKKSETDMTYLEAETNYVPDLEQFRIWRNSPEFRAQVRTLEDLTW